MNLKKIDELKRLVKNITLFEKIDMSKIDFVNAMLKNENIAEMPDEYKEMLLKHNGIIASPLEFYGTEIIDRENHNYKFPNIIEANKIFVESKNPLILNRVLIGILSFDMIVFDDSDKKYKILNRSSFETIEIFDDLDMLFDYIIEHFS